jgi:hypothetical protein
MKAIISHVHAEDEQYYDWYVSHIGDKNYGASYYDYMITF